MNKLILISVLFILAVITAAANADIHVIWEKDLSQTYCNDITRVKLSPDSNNVFVFHYRHDWSEPTHVEKLDAATGNVVWAKTVTKSGERITWNGWVDSSGNLFITPTYGGYTLWKYDSELATELWSYTGSSGFEYVETVITDELNDVYASGYTGSFSGDGSSIIKLTSSGSLVWSNNYKATNSNDSYSMLALDSNKNLFRGGHDGGARPTDCGRLLGHSASNGDIFLNVSLQQTNSSVYGVLVDAEDNLYMDYSYDIWISYGVKSGEERSAIQKIDQQGNAIWEYLFDDVGIFFERNNIVKHTDNSFYVSFTLRKNGTVYPGVAEITSDGALLWKETVDNPGWVVAYSGIDAEGNNIYLGLNKADDRNQTKVLCFYSEPTDPIQEILDFIEKSVADGTLVPVKPPPAGEKQLGALINMIEAAGNLIDANDPTSLPEACGQLRAALGKTDGQDTPPDFVTGPAAPQLAAMIEELMDSLGCN